MGREPVLLPGELGRVLGLHGGCRAVEFGPDLAGENSSLHIHNRLAVPCLRTSRPRARSLPVRSFDWLRRSFYLQSVVLSSSVRPTSLNKDNRVEPSRKTYTLVDVFPSNLLRSNLN